MEEHTEDELASPGRSRLWLAVALAFVAAAVWAGMALAAARSSSKPTSTPAAAAQLSSGFVATKAAPSNGNCPHMGNGSGSSSGATTTPGL